MPHCIMCGESTFNEFDGNFFCINCGTQTQELRNEVDVEVDTENLGFGHSQQKQLISKRKKPERRSKYLDADFGKPWLTYEAIQCLLKAQVKAFVDLGVDPALKNIVCQIWFHFLSKKGVAFTGAHEGSFIATEAMKMRRDVNLGETPSTKPKKEVVNRTLLHKEEKEKEQVEEEDKSFDSASESTIHSEMEEYTSESDEDDYFPKEHIGSVRYKHEDVNANWTILQHRHTIVFIYIGLLYLKEPITVADILRLVTRGHVPYHRMSCVLPGHMKFSKEDMSTFSYRPLNAKKIHEGTNFLMNYLDLPEIPAPDYYLLIAKLILDFQLPAAIHRLTVSLVKACGYKPRTKFKYSRRAACNEYYEEMVMAFIVVAIKLVYGLDGETEINGNILTKYLDVPVEEIDCWNCIVLRLEKKKRHDIQSNYPTCEKDLSYLHSYENYALYCAEEVFRDANSKQFASRQKPWNIHSQYKACMSDAKEEYYGIMKEAVADLEHGKPLEFRKLSSSSFVYDHIPRVEAIDTSCRCHRSNKSAASSLNLDDMIGSDEMRNAFEQRVEHSPKNKDTYLIYLNDLSGLKVHDSYRFLLDVFSRRIQIKAVDLHDYVTYVETLLFVDAAP